MELVVRDTQAKVAVAFYDADGNATDPDPGFENAVTVTITDSAGVALVTDAAATNEAGAGRYSRTLSVAQTAVLDRYEARWRATIAGAVQTVRTYFEVAGGVICSIADVRAFDPDLSVAAGYDTAEVLRARTAAEEWIEELCGVAFRPRGHRESVDGTNRPHLLLSKLYPRRIVSASIDTGSGAVALTAAELADLAVYPHGVVVRRTTGRWTAGHRNCAIFYEHGLDEAPQPVRQATLELIRYFLVENPIPARALSYSTEEASYRLSTAGRDGPTGIPFVDSVVREFGHEQPAVG